MGEGRVVQTQEVVAGFDRIIRLAGIRQFESAVDERKTVRPVAAARVQRAGQAAVRVSERGRAARGRRHRHIRRSVLVVGIKLRAEIVGRSVDFHRDGAARAVVGPAGRFARVRSRLHAGPCAVDIQIVGRPA